MFRMEEKKNDLCMFVKYFGDHHMFRIKPASLCFNEEN